MGGCEEMRGSVADPISDLNGSVVCPKPRLLAGNLTMSIRWQHRSQQSEFCDSISGAELLDLIIIRKEGHCDDQFTREVASSPPFFRGTPPSRVSNPIVQDAQFGDDNLSPLSTLQHVSSPSTSVSSSMSPSAMKSGFVRMKFGLKSPTVRVEGFDCLSRDRQNLSITAVA